MSGVHKGLLFNIQKFSIHDGPGIRTTVFLKGCPLRCRWCANPESQSPSPQLLGGAVDSRWYTVEEVVQTCLQDWDFYEESGGGVTVSGGEPLVQHEFAVELLRSLRERGIHTAIETTGYVQPDVLVRALQWVDLVLYDVKHYDDARHRQGTGLGNEAILGNLRRCATHGVPVLPRIPVIPDYNADLSDAKGFARLLRELGIDRVQLLPFHQMGEKKYELLGKTYALQGVRALYPEHLQSYRDAFWDSGVRAYFELPPNGGCAGAGGNTNTAGTQTMGCGENT